MKKIKILKRERINHILSSIYDYPLTIIEAPMGYGKTTAVKDFFSEQDNPFVWVSIVDTEDNVSFFWNEFSKQICKLDKEIGDKLKSLGFPLDAPQKSNVLSILNNIVFKQKTAIVIDDFHLVKDRRINELISQFVIEEIENLYFVAITRDTNNLNIAELTVKGLCNTISHRQLKFNKDEIQEYCNMMSQKISERDFINISEYTDGWISLIYLILLGLEKGAPIGMNTTIDELVEKNLYNPYDENIKQFLLKLAVMEGFTSVKASFVTEEPKADEYLKKLHKENAFVYYDEVTGVYKIHNVLLDYLRIKQKFDKDKYKETYNRVGEWYFQQGELINAYNHFYIAGNVERILFLLNDKDNISNDLSKFQGSAQMFNSAPKELLLKYPIAYLQHIFIGILECEDDDTMKNYINNLQELEDFYNNNENVTEVYRKRIIAEIKIVSVFTEFNDIEKMSKYYPEIISLLEGEQSWIAIRENESNFGCPEMIYIYYKEQGKLEHIKDVLNNRSYTYAMFSDGCSTGIDYLTLAEYSLETGDWNNAELNAFKAIYKAKTKQQTGLIINANFVLIRLYIFQGKIQEGLKLLQQIQLEVSTINSSIYNTTIELCKGYAYGCLQELDKIPLWLRIGDMSSAYFFFEGMAFNYIVYGKAVMLSENYIQLEMLTESFEEYFSMFNNQLGFLNNFIFTAVAKYKLYGMEEGKTALKRALELGHSDNIILPFGENASYIIDMLRQLASEDKSNQYIIKVLSCCEQYMESLGHTEKKEIYISPREVEVLKLISEGLTRKDIAEELNLSVSTIKTHLQNIYLKMGVSGKISAIRKAEEMKLF